MVRRLQLLVLAVVLVVAAFSTGYPFLFFLVYLGLLVGGGSYILTRLGLADLEAGYAVSQLSGYVGDRLRVTYTLRNTGRLPKPWLEVHNPTSAPRRPAGPCPVPRRPPRALLDGPDGPGRRGHFRIDPLQIRTGDPFGFFEASAGVGHGITLVVYPRIEALPLWRLPPANIEGAHASPSGRCRRRRSRRRSARTPRRLHEPDPLADHRPPRRDPGQGVRAGADRRRVAVPGPRRGVRGGPGTTTPPRRSPSAPRPRSPTRRWARTVPWA